MQSELTELTEKLVKLQLFMAGEEFRKLPGHSRNLLAYQSRAMATYAHVLSERISFG